MSRTSNDVYVNGILLNGRDYSHFADVIDGFYVDCQHPRSMDCGCYGRIHQGERCTQTFKQDIESYNVPPRVKTQSQSNLVEVSS